MAFSDEKRQQFLSFTGKESNYKITSSRLLSPCIPLPCPLALLLGEGTHGSRVAVWSRTMPWCRCRVPLAGLHVASDHSAHLLL